MRSLVLLVILLFSSYCHADPLVLDSTLSLSSEPKEAYFLVNGKADFYVPANISKVTGAEGVYLFSASLNLDSSSLPIWGTLFLNSGDNVYVSKTQKLGSNIYLLGVKELEEKTKQVNKEIINLDIEYINSQKKLKSLKADVSYIGKYKELDEYSQLSSQYEKNLIILREYNTVIDSYIEQGDYVTGASLQRNLNLANEHVSILRSKDYSDDTLGSPNEESADIDLPTELNNLRKERLELEKLLNSGDSR